MDPILLARWPTEVSQGEILENEGCLYVIQIYFYLNIQVQRISSSPTSISEIKMDCKNVNLAELREAPTFLH